MVKSYINVYFGPFLAFTVIKLFLKDVLLILKLYYKVDFLSVKNFNVFLRTNGECVPFPVKTNAHILFRDFLKTKAVSFVHYQIDLKHQHCVVFHFCLWEILEIINVLVSSCNIFSKIVVFVKIFAVWWKYHLILEVIGKKDWVEHVYIYVCACMCVHLWQSLSEVFSIKYYL